MVVLVTGGSGSGKSAWAEDLALELCGGAKYYLATMRPFGAEARQRIARHRDMRAHKGFQTIECPQGLEGLALPPGSTALLEDLSNLLANIRFAPAPPPDCAGALYKQLAPLIAGCGHLILVGNEVFSDGIAYDCDTMDYLAQLGRLHQSLAARADLVVEVVCGLPLVLKGVNPCSAL